MSPQATFDCDLLVIGGGINGAGIARDAAGRGLRVILCEQHDLASHTSSASTKLIHGGLRYLENYEFGLVRKALREREVLLRSAPHIMGPLRFVMPHWHEQRPAWLIRSGLFLYDHLARRVLLPASESLALAKHPSGRGLQARFGRGFAYSDGWVDDARLVVLCAMAAAERGAQVLTRHRVEHLADCGDGWQAGIRAANGTTLRVRARAAVNAAGPWATRLPDVPLPPGRSLRLVKGSHIVVPRLFAHDYAYLFQQPDERVVFAIPYEHDFTLIGTTDVDYAGDPAKVGIDDAEIQYLCDAVNRFAERRLAPSDVVWHYAGVRPLLDDHAASASATTRDYLLEWQPAAPPLIHVLGGKLTTFRQLAEDVVDRLAPRLGNTVGAWTRQAPLPGGDNLLANGPHVRNVLHFGDWVEQQGQRYPWLPAALLHRYARAYGSRLHTLLAHCEGRADLGDAVLPGLHVRELEYLRRHEWARTADDILWRRSKLGLHLPASATATLQDWLDRNRLEGLT
ncbi:MAG: glycerol-3-phosphate dehydrogenase [Pigmentiphaga sp.]|nr:glycerol-3-phosphate dehydrogenase [Pigmentiphaga sp.]